MVQTPTLKPFGTWPSPVSPAMLTEGLTRLGDVWVDGDHTYWSEGRPAEGGRTQIVRLGPDGSRTDMLPDGFNARSGVHEYGGGAALVRDGVIWFVNWADQRLYVLRDAAPPVALTPEPEVARSIRFADLRVSPDGRWIVCVMESHGSGGATDVRNELVCLDAFQPSTPRLLFGGADFVASPRFVDGARLRWIAWDHPNMPWNDTSLLEATFVDGALTQAPRVMASGGSWMQPVGECVLSDRTDWWNVWHVDAAGAATPVAPLAAEVGGPAWVFGLRDYVITPSGVPAFAIGGDVHVGDEVTATGVQSLGQWTLHADGHTVTAVARYTDRHPAIVRFTLTDPAAMTVVVPGAPVALDAADISIGRTIEYPSTGGRTAHGVYYPPTNHGFTAPAGSSPPLIVMIHGGPTSQAGSSFDLDVQFWTTRGFAVVDVDYGGSTGYGREVRNELDGEWGIVDVDDCCAAAQWLADQGLADAHRLAIRGGSAGGFTVLAALAFRDVFAVGASHYGIADLSALAEETHKFESRYTDRLIGPWPEARSVYEERSPIHHIDGFDRPLIVFQGLDDMVVPPNQAEMIVAALRAKGVECEYHPYEGEGHGFRRAETIQHALEHELAFYQRVLGLV